MKTIYTWTYLNQLIKKYLKTDKDFIEDFNSETGNNISYETFRQQKRRGSKKFLQEYIDHVLNTYDKPLVRLGEQLVETFMELISNNLTKQYIEFKNEGSYFAVYKSWDKVSTDNIHIKNELFLFIDEIALTKVFQEIFEDDVELQDNIKSKIKKYIDKKLDLVDYLRFSIKEYGINIELKFNKITIGFNIPLEEFTNTFISL